MIVTPPTTKDDPPDVQPASIPGIALLSAVVVALPLARFFVVWSTPVGSGDFNRSVTVGPLDAVLVVVMAAAIVVGPAFRLPTRPAGMVSAAFGVAAVSSMAVHPSWLGLGAAYRLLAALAVVHLARCVGERGRIVALSAFAGLSIVEAAMGVAQSLTGRTLGLEPFEFAGTGLERGDLVAATGSFQHEYQLTTLLLAGMGTIWFLRSRAGSGRTGWLWTFGLGAVAFGATFTFSRAAVLGWVIALLVAGVSGDPWRRIGAAALALGMVFGMSVGASGWLERGSESTDLERVDNRRRENLAEAVDLFADNPVLGVGLGRNVAVEEARGIALPQPPHNIVFHALAETGAVGAAALAVMLAVGAVWAWRAGVDVTIAVLLYAPMLFLDAVPYVMPQGLLVSAFWIITLRTAADGRP